MNSSWNWLRNLLKPSKTVPRTPWTADSQWSINLTRLFVLIFGLFLFGTGESLLIVSDIGNSPWTVLSQGVSKQLDLSIGSATFLVSIFVILLWIPLREKPGFGTLANILVIAVAIDFGIYFLPKQSLFAFELIYVLLGITLVGLGSALYITCGLGSGPRDGWMTALHRRSGIAVGKVRLAIELLVLLTGWVLGGVIGIGTALFALLIGQSVAIWFGVVSRLTAR